MSLPIRILIVDDHTVVCESLATLIDEQPDMQTVATAGEGEAAVNQAQQVQPDIILMDIDMPGLDCFEACRRISEAAPDARLVFLSGYRRDSYIEKALKTRAWGYLLKWGSVDDLLGAIRRIHCGAVCVAPEVRARLVSRGSAVPGWDEKTRTRLSLLTARELEVLRHIAAGRTRREAAERMGLSEKTVAGHLHTIMTKLDIHDRVVLAKFAIAEGLTES